MPRFRLLIEYAGTRYSGWQIQKNARTVQGEIDRAIRTATGRVRIRAVRIGTDRRRRPRARRRSRTSTSTRTCRRSRCGAGSTTSCPPTSTSSPIDKAPHKFHARHDAESRSYLYQISRRRTAFAKPYVWWIKEPLDLAAMRKAAAAFVGLNDFEAFTDDDPGEKSTRVLLERLEIAESGALVLIRVQGSHFLWKMVRRIVGVLAAVGRGELKPSDASALLTREPPPRGLAPAALTAPSAGLFLEGVYCDGDPGPGGIKPVVVIG